MNRDICKIIHDMRSPMQVCSGFIKFVRSTLETRNKPSLSQLKEYCNIASKSVENILSLIDKLEEIVKKESR